MNEEKANNELNESYTIPKQSTSSIFDLLIVKKIMYENAEIFLANLNIHDIPKDKIKKSVGNYIYYFEVRRNKYNWKIKRSLQDFHDLFSCLFKKNKTITILRDFLHHISLKSNYNDPNNILSFIEKSLQIMLKTPALHRDLDLLAFFEVSFVPLEKGTKKYKECYIWKRSGGRFKPDNIFFRCGLYCKVWSKRWLVIRQDGVLYTLGPSVDKSYIREILFFDSSFQIIYGKKYTNSAKGIILTASSRKLHLEALNFLQFYDIINSLKEACSACPYTQINRFLSFSPARICQTYCKWYIDAEDYYNDIYEVIKRAKEEIFIADWWLSPELFLKRPITENLNEDSRLDHLLLKAAEEGVRINIILYKEVTLALTNDSYYSKTQLEKLHKNIKVLRHPKDMIFLWSHHEKILIIDQEIAFLGGLDLCYGRFDTQTHHLKDIACDDNQKFEGMFPGIDYYNVRIVDFTNVRNFTQSTINKSKDQRMPWHDIAIRMIGDPVKDLTRHFIQYWNFVTYDLLKKTKKNTFLEVTVQENKGHSQTITNLMENSFIKKEREKAANKGGLMKKIQKKFQQTKESVRKILYKGTPESSKKKPSSLNVFRFPSNEGLGNDKKQQSEVENKSLSEESEELMLTRKKVSVYLDHINLDFEESAVLKPESEEEIKEVQENNSNHLESHSENFDDNEEGLSEIKKSALEKNFIGNKNHLVLKFANAVDVFYPSNSNEKINEIKISSGTNGKNQLQIANTPLENKKRFPSFNEHRIKKKVEFRKSGSINICQLKIPRILLHEESGKFNLEKERVCEMLADKDLYNFFDYTPTKKISRSHQDVLMGMDKNVFMSEEKNSFRKKLEEFTSADDHAHVYSPQKKNFLNNPNTEILIQNDNNQNIDLLKSNYYIKINKKPEASSPISKRKKLKNFFLKNKERLNLNFKNLKENLKNFRKQKQPKSEEEMGKNESSFSPENTINSKKYPEEYPIKNFLAPNPKKFVNEFFSSKMTCSCQILRSASSWSLGLGPYQTEKSIHMAYIQLIEQAKHFIYIENQFFISHLAGLPVENLIANALLLRIKQAHSKKEKFKVMVFLPLLPGFPGDIDKTAAGVLKIQLHWEYYTISRGGNSILECLTKEGINPNEYIHFFSLRGHDIVSGIPKTEIIYIHSKMMMIDDHTCLIGSANINDRSMIGSRDSEIAVVVEDTKKLEGKMAGKDYRAADFIYNLRINLFKEHFGLEFEESVDPLDEKMWRLILERTKKNTDIFREVFRCYPDDQIKHTDDIFEFEEKRNLDKYDKLKNEIKGHAVFFPTKFLEKQSLKLPIFTKEYLVPDINFV